MEAVGLCLEERGKPSLSEKLAVVKFHTWLSDFNSSLFSVHRGSTAMSNI